MTLEQFNNVLAEKKRRIDSLTDCLEEIDRVDRIIFRYKPTEEYIGNHGYAEGDNGYNVVIAEDPADRNGYNRDAAIFLELKALYKQHLEKELVELKEDIKIMTDKKAQAEAVLGE